MQTRTFTCGPIELTMWLSDDTESFGMVISNPSSGIEVHHIAPTFSEYIGQMRQLESIAEWVEMLPPCDNCGQNANNLETHGMISCLPCHERALTETYQIWLYNGEDIGADGLQTLQDAMNAVADIMADPTYHRYCPLLVTAQNDYGDERNVSRIVLLGAN